MLRRKRKSNYPTRFWPRWKKRSEKKKRKLRRLAFLLLGALVFLLGARQVFKFQKTLTRSLNRGNCWSQGAKIGRFGRVNVVFIQDPIIIASLNRVDHTLFFLLIPSQTYTELPRGFGLYRLANAYQLAALNNGCGGRFMAESVQEFLALPIDGYVKIPDTKHQILSNSEAKAWVDKVKSIGWLARPRQTYQFLKAEVRTNFSLFDMLKLWLEVRKVRFDKVGFEDLSQRAFFSELVLPDGTRGLKANPAAFDALVGKALFDPKVRNEGLKIEVLNGTAHPGLGARVGRLVTGLGANLVHVGNAEERVSESLLLVGDKKLVQSSTAQRLKFLLNAKVLVKKPKEARGDLVVVVGEDYYKRLTEKSQK